MMSIVSMVVRPTVASAHRKLSQPRGASAAKQARRLGSWSTLLMLGGASVAGCSGSDVTEIAPLNEQTQLGAVSLGVTTAGLTLVELAVSVADANGSPVLSQEVDVSDPNAALSSYLELPAARGYVVTLTALTLGGSRCTGRAVFDVVQAETREVRVALVCSAPSATVAGGAVVVGTVIPAATCPALQLAVAPLQASVGASLELAATGLGRGTVRWSASAGAIADAGQSATRFTCTAPGPVTLTLSNVDPACPAVASTTVQCLATLPEPCEGLGRTCHVVDPGSGPLHECHELGHAGDAAVCAERRADCISGCGAALCRELGPLCHEVDPGSGPLHECHELGHAGDSAQCFARGRDCFDLCTAARAAQQTPAAVADAGSPDAALEPESDRVDGPLAVSLSFAARVGSEAFSCDALYQAQGAARSAVRVQDLRLLVSQVGLVSDAGSVVPLRMEVRPPFQDAEIALLDFETGEGSCSGDALINTVITGSVPQGSYRGLRFTVGVPESRNHQDPSLQPPPLQAGAMQWSWLAGYRFLRAEVVGEVAQGLPGAGLLHLGSTGCTGRAAEGQVSCARSNRAEVVLSDYVPGTQRVVLDIGALFADTDLSMVNECHSTGAACPQPFEHLGLDFGTGLPTPSASQTVFRLE